MGSLRLVSVASTVVGWGYPFVPAEVAADVVRAVESQVIGDLRDGSIGLQQQPGNALDPR